MDTNIYIIPIETLQREVLLTFEWLVFFFFLENALLFYIQFRRRGKRSFNISDDKAYIYLFIGLSFTRFFRILGDYYFSKDNLMIYFSNISNIIRILSLLVCVYFIEKEKNFYKSHLFSKILLSYTIIYFILLPINYENILLYSIPIYLIFLIFSYNYIHDLKKKSKILRKEKHYGRIFFLGVTGFFLISIGTVLTHKLFYFLFGFILRILGLIVLIFGISFINHFFLSISSLSEYDWSNHIKKLLISKKSGLCLYEKTCALDDKNHENVLLSGALAVMNIHLENMSEKESFTIIEKEGDYIMVCQGKYIISILITDVKLNSLKLILKSFVEKIEFIYSNLLENWQGGLKIFTPIDDIVNEFFFLN